MPMLKTDEANCTATEGVSNRQPVPAERPSGGGWRLVRVHSGAEAAAAAALSQLGLDAFSPVYRARRRWSDPAKLIEFAVFPGYLFCRFDARDALPVLTTPSVRAIVSFGSDWALLPEREVEAIRRFAASGVEVRPWPLLPKGNWMRVAAGRLAGLEGLSVERENGAGPWLVVPMPPVRRSIAAEVQGCALEPVMEAPLLEKELVSSFSS